MVEQVGRLPSGEPAAVIRGLSRVRIGVGTVGPGRRTVGRGNRRGGAAGQPARARSWRASTASLAAAILQKRGAWQVVDVLQRITDPSALADSAGLRLRT